MKSTLFIPISLPITRSSGIKGDRWRLCCMDFSWSLSSSSKLSLGNSSRANEWKWEIDSFSCEQGGVGKIDDGESKQGVRRSRRRLPGVSGDMKQLGSWGMILFFFWSLSVSSMTNKCCSRFAADPKVTYVPWSMLLWRGWRWIKLLSQPPKRADSCKPITASYLFPPKLYYAARSRCFLEPVTNANNFSLTLLYGPNRRICKGRNDRIPNQKNRNGIEFKQPYLASVFVSLHRVSFLGWSRAM